MIQFFLLDATSIPPSPTPSGIDLHAPERIDLPPGAQYKTGSKLGIKIPKGYVGLLFARSKMASDTGIQAISQIIHHDFDGELQIVLQNKGKVDKYGSKYIGTFKV